MDTLKEIFSQKRNLISLIIALVLLVALPGGLYLVRTQQIFKPKAFGPPGGPQVSVVSNSPVEAGNPNDPAYISFDVGPDFVGRVEIWLVPNKDFTNPDASSWWRANSIGCNSTSNSSAFCHGAYTWYPDAQDAATDTTWKAMVDVYDENNQLICTGDGNGDSSYTPGNIYCGDGSHRDIIIGNATPTNGYGCNSNNQCVPVLGGNLPPGCNDSCGQTTCQNPCNPLQEGVCTTSGAKCINGCFVPNGCSGGSGTLTVGGNQVGLCSNNQATVVINVNYINGYAYQFYRDNIAIYSTSFSGSIMSATDTNVPAGSHTYSVTATSGGQQLQGSTPITVSCNGGGGGGGTPNCTVNPPITGNGVSGTLMGPFSVTGLGGGNFGCTWNVYPINSSGTTVPTYLTQNCNLPFSFTPTLSDISTTGSFRVVAQVPVTSSNTVICNSATVTVVGGSIGGGYACNSFNQCVATPGGPLPAGCNGPCGGGTGGVCNATTSCSGTCNGTPNTCNTNNGTQSCVYTTLNGSTNCTSAQAPNQPCNAGNLCSAGTSCIGGQCQGVSQDNFGCVDNQCVALAGNLPPGCNNTCQSSPTNPTRVKLANKAGGQSCTDALAASNEFFNLNGQSSVDASHNLIDNVPGLKTVCAQFYFGDTPVAPILEKSINLVINTITPSVTTTPTNPVASPTTTQTNNTCSMNLVNNQTVSGGSVQTAITGTKTNSSYYLSFWAIGSKVGDIQLASTQANVLNPGWSSINLFNNGPAILECRIQSGQSGGTIFANRVTVNVQNGGNNTPSPTTTFASPTLPSQCTQSKGDANRDGQVNGIDFTIWSNEFLSNTVRQADFNCDGQVNGIDFTIWSNEFLRTHP